MSNQAGLGTHPVSVGYLNPNKLKIQYVFRSEQVIHEFNTKDSKDINVYMFLIITKSIQLRESKDVKSKREISNKTLI